MTARATSSTSPLTRSTAALLARAANRTRTVRGEPTTSDSDIERRRWLALDFDPVRPAGVSSTDEEKSAALLRAEEVRDHLRGEGWPEPVVGDSGNGAHLLYRVDLPNDPESSELVKGVLEALDFGFSDGAVEVDTAVANAARIWKLYGTTARKGDHTNERPHRRSALLEAPEGAAAEVVGRDELEDAASRRPGFPSRQARSFGPDTNGHKGFDLAGWIERHGVLVRRQGPWGQGGYRYVLEKCPVNGHSDGATYIVRFTSGAIAAGCHHNSCRGLDWADFREHYEPGAYGRDGSRDWPDETGSFEALPPRPRPGPRLPGRPSTASPARSWVPSRPTPRPIRWRSSPVCSPRSATPSGAGPFFRVGADLHYLKLNTGLVGDTSKGRKGTSWGPVRELMRDADEPWIKTRVHHGLSSGEGLIYTVRDRVKDEDKNGEAKVLDEGVEDKRLLVLEAELAGVLKVMRRVGNTLSPIVRQAWDDGDLQTLTKYHPMKATDAHVSLIIRVVSNPSTSRLAARP